MNADERHWLVRPENIRLLWRIFIAVLAVVVVAELPLHGESHFGIDDWFSFHAVYGFVTCVGMILFAKLLGMFLKRRDTYYDD